MEKYKYMELTEIIRKAIDSGEYPIGKPLPGERELAQKHRYSRQTVRKAIGVLCDENVLKPVHGSGNFVLKKTRRAKSGMVAVIATHIALPHFASTLLTIEKTLMDGGYYPIIATTDNHFDLERKVIEDLLDKNVDGLIVEGVRGTIPNLNIELYKEIVSQGIPLVFINTRYHEIDEAVYVSMDNTQGGELCGNYLISRGHTNFAGIFKADDQESLLRYGGLAGYAGEHGYPISDSNILWYTNNRLHESLEDFAVSCIESCSAVACFNDEVAFYFHEALRQKGVKIPHDFEFVAFDRTEFAERLPHKITVLEYRQEAIGHLTAQKMVNMIQGQTERTQYLQWQLFDAKGKALAPRDIP